jgi:hypothetical protein
VNCHNPITNKKGEHQHPDLHVTCGFLCSISDQFGTATDDEVFPLILRINRLNEMIGGNGIEIETVEEGTASPDEYGRWQPIILDGG